MYIEHGDYGYVLQLFSVGNNLLIVFQSENLEIISEKGGFRENFLSATLTNRSCQFVQVDTKVITTLLVLRGMGHAGKEVCKKWGSVLVVSITWCRSRSVIQIM